MSGLLALLAATTVLSACGTSGQWATAGAASETGDGAHSALILASSGGQSSPLAAVSDVVTVHMVGAVKSPGLYEVPKGSRVADGVTAAGGVAAKGDTTLLNMARLLVDGEQIRVPVKGDPVPAEAGQTESPIVNLNTASISQLETLPKVGPAMAQRIVDYRTETGGFRSIDELRNVSGIGDKTFEVLKPLVAV